MGNKEMSFDRTHHSLVPRLTECGVNDLHIIKLSSIVLLRIFNINLAEEINLQLRINL